jgi:hypothetical protein
MKKRSQILVLVMVLTMMALEPASLKAQTFKNGDLVANLGAGFGWYGYGYGVNSLPAFTLSMEKGFKEIDKVGPISIGGIVGFKHASYAWQTSHDWSWNDIIVAGRGALHYDLFKQPKVDTYAGVAIGVRIESWSYYTTNLSHEYVKAHENSTNALMAVYAGIRYYFTDNIAAFGEVGYGLGYLTLGLSYKF